MPISIVVTDNDDGTATVTPTGGPLNVERSTWPLVGPPTWVQVATGVAAPTTVAGVGCWLWRGRTVSETSEVFYRPVGDPQAQITYRVRDAVRDIVAGLGLEGLPGQNIVTQEVPVVLETDVLPRCIIAPDQVPPEPPRRSLSFVHRTVGLTVAFVQPVDTQKPRQSKSSAVTWSDQTQSHFLKLKRPSLSFPTVQLIDMLQVVPDVSVNFAAFQSQYIWSAFGLRVRHRGTI